jgi:hypothetical protein
MRKPAEYNVPRGPAPPAPPADGLSPARRWCVATAIHNCYACLPKRTTSTLSQPSQPPAHARAGLLTLTKLPCSWRCDPRFHTSRTGRRVRLPIRNVLRRVFHIVSTGEPALAVQAGNLRRSPRHRLAGARGLRVPVEQGTGLQGVIHSLSRPLAAKRPGWPPSIQRFSTEPGSRRRLLVPGPHAARRRHRGPGRGGNHTRTPPFVHRAPGRGVDAQ